MAKNFNDSKYKKLLALCLSVFTVTSAFATLSACNTTSSDDDDTTNEEVTTTEKDDSVITNGSFEYNSKGDTTLIVTSPSGWTRSTNSATSGSASSSQSASGIVDTTASVWDDLTQSAIFKTLGKQPEDLTVAEAEANWSKMSKYDKLKFFEAYEDADSDNDVDELSFYDADTDAFNIDAEDIPLPSDGNPGTHYKEGDEGYGEESNVLMIHNQYTDNRGTAQKYTSSTTVTVPAGAAAEVSVWVKTSDLQFKHTSGTTMDALGNRGAYIGITHTVGGNTLDQFMVKNINTKNDQGVNEWVEYNFYLQGSSYADSTFTMVLGLGLTGGTDTFEYVNGYAFFDDIKCEILTADEYEVPANTPRVTLEADGTAKTFKADVAKTTETPNGAKGVTAFEIDLQPSEEFAPLTLTAADFKTGITEEVKGSSTLVSANGEKLTDGEKEVYGDFNLDVSFDKFGYFSDFAAIQAEAEKKDPANAEKYANSYFKAVYDKNFADSTVDFKNVLLLMSKDGAAYTSKLSKEFTVAAGERIAVSFFLKTSDIAGFTGAGITLHDGENCTSFDSLDTSGSAAVDINDENKDIYDGWQQCFFFVENDTETDKTFTLSFTYGKTVVYGTTKADYYPGFAAFANFTTLPMTEEEYKCASTGTYAKTVSLVAGEDEEKTGAEFDAVATVPSGAIETGLADPKNYKGVVGGSKYVSVSGTDGTVNSSEYAGLLNKEYIEEYEKTEWLKNLNLAELFGNATQPLLIYNNDAQAYGFIGTKQTVAADSYQAVSVRVKVSAGATAYVYLVDATNVNDQKVLSVSQKVSYWYDADGNVCEEDPSKNEKKSNIAFKLQSNGLYTANAQWDKAESYKGYYANLANYEKDASGNLIVAEGGVSYNYNEKWENAGNDGIAFYYNKADQKYYAYLENGVYKTEVKDLATVVNSENKTIARYKTDDGKISTNEGNAFVKIVGTAETAADWQTVTFYIHTGSVEKNYRLEVWSGSRDGQELSATGSYVLFDSNNPGTLDETTYTSLVEELEDEATRKFSDTFSFYDSDKFLRYDADIDENEVGNSYTSYVSSSYSEGVAYLEVSKNDVYQKFLNYSIADTTVTADVEEDDEQTEEENTATVSETNIFLLISSLAIAGVLLLAVVSLIVRKVFLKRRGKKSYVVKPEKKAKKERKQKAPKTAKPVETPTETTDDTTPYED